MESLMITAAEILQEISSFLSQKLLQIGEYLLIFFSIILDATAAFLQSLFYALSLLMLATLSLGTLVAHWLGDKLNSIYVSAIKFSAVNLEYFKYNNSILIIGAILIFAVVFLLFWMLLKWIEEKKQAERRRKQDKQRQAELREKQDKQRQAYQNTLAHISKTLAERQFVCFMPHGSIQQQTAQLIKSQLEKHEAFIGKMYSFALSQGIDNGLIAFVTGKLVDFSPSRQQAVNKILEGIESKLQKIHLLSFKFQKLQASFLVVARGDSLTSDTTILLREEINAIGNMLIELEGEWNIHILRQKIGYGISHGVGGIMLLIFETEKEYDHVSSLIRNTTFGTPSGEMAISNLKSVFLNPIFFGGIKGNITVVPVALILDNHTLRYFGNRNDRLSKWANHKWITRIVFGFTEEDLLPKTV